MSVPHLTPAVEAPTAAAAATLLRRRGLRLSAARRLVLAALFAADAAAERRGDRRRRGRRLPPSDLASVYRNLETLEALGLVRHMHLGHGPGRYAPAGPRRTTSPRASAAARAPSSRARPRRRSATAVRDAVGFEPFFHHFPLAGLCPACAGARHPTHRSGRARPPPDPPARVRERFVARTTDPATSPVSQPPRAASHTRRCGCHTARCGYLANSLRSR